MGAKLAGESRSGDANVALNLLVVDAEVVGEVGRPAALDRDLRAPAAHVKVVHGATVGKQVGNRLRAQHELLVDVNLADAALAPVAQLDLEGERVRAHPLHRHHVEVLYRLALHHTYTPWRAHLVAKRNVPRAVGGLGRFRVGLEDLLFEPA